MRIQPSFSEGEVAAHLRSEHGLDVCQVAFLPVGEASWCYIAVDASAARWFVRLARVSQENVADLLAIVAGAVTGASVQAPRGTPAGHYATTLHGLHVTVVPYAHGPTLRAHGVGDAEHAALGTFLAGLHSLTLPTALRARLGTETFRRHLHESEAVLRALNGSGSMHARELGALVAVQRPVIDRIVTAAADLGATLRADDLPLVLCHADIHTDNVLVDADGILHIIDWDGALLAPRERDLMFFGDPARWPAAFRDAYSPDREPDPDALRYYRLEWVLQEIAGYGGRVLDSSLPDPARADALGQFRALFNPGDVVESALQQLDRAARNLE